MELQLTYMSGAGNLFTVIDNRDGLLSEAQAATLAPILCDTQSLLGYKVEGLLLIQSSVLPQTNFEVLFFNPDGSTSMMCGNGARCAVRFAVDIGCVGPDNKNIQFKMAGAMYSAHLIIEDNIVTNDTLVEVLFAPPRVVDINRTLQVDGLLLAVDYIDVESDHVVLNEVDLNVAFRVAGRAMSFLDIAPQIRRHPSFERGANVNLYRMEDSLVFLQTYERGVEAITGACGTGALSTAVALFMRSKRSLRQFSIVPPSQEKLSVQVHCNEANEITSLSLRGGARVLTKHSIQITT